MLLNDVIVAAHSDGFSGVNIKCDEGLIDVIASEFESLFATKLDEAITEAEEDYDCECKEREEEVDLAISPVAKDDHVYAYVPPLYLTFGSRADNEYAPDVLYETLNELKMKYPDITYECVLAYEWSDEHGGDVVNEERTSEGEVPEGKTYDFIKDTLHFIFDNEDLKELFWEKMGWILEMYDSDDVTEIAENFRTYGIAEEEVDTLMELADDLGLLEELENLANS